MSRPSLRQRYAGTANRPSVEFHLQGCACEHCQPVGPPLPIAKLTLAAIVAGNAIAFAWDWDGALQALAAAVGLHV